VWWTTEHSSSSSEHCVSCQQRQQQGGLAKVLLALTLGYGSCVEAGGCWCAIGLTTWCICTLCLVYGQ
jgi:hypothetical protein